MANPKDLLYTAEHLWIAVEGDTAKIGLTEHAAEELGDILFVDLPSVGDTFAAGEIFSEVESSKTNSELAMPFDGEVVAVNEELDDSPEAINDDAYAAWIAQFKFEGQLEGMSAADYEATL